MKRLLPTIIVVLVGAATIAGGTILYRAKRPVLLTMNRASASDSSRHSIGSADAPVTLDEFGDFECPPCGKLSEPLNQLVHDFAPRVRMVFHNFPLPTHKFSWQAAWAAEAAGVQGKFWQMHDMIYKDQAVWANSIDATGLFNAYAAYLGLDVQRFKADFENPEVRERVAADQREGSALGVKNTPTIFINHAELDPKQLNPPALRMALEEALRKPKP